MPFCLACDPPVENPLDSFPEFPDLAWTHPYLDELSAKYGVTKIGEFIFDEDDEVTKWWDAKIAIREIDRLVDLLVNMKDSDFCDQYPDARGHAICGLAGMRWYLQEACRNNRSICFLCLST
jgi:hypothetical protein